VRRLGNHTGVLVSSKLPAISIDAITVEAGRRLMNLVQKRLQATLRGCSRRDNVNCVFSGYDVRLAGIIINACPRHWLALTDYALTAHAPYEFHIEIFPLLSSGLLSDWDIR